MHDLIAPMFTKSQNEYSYLNPTNVDVPKRYFVTVIKKLFRKQPKLLLFQSLFVLQWLNWSSIPNLSVPIESHVNEKSLNTTINMLFNYIFIFINECAATNQKPLLVDTWIDRSWGVTVYIFTIKPFEKIRIVWEFAVAALMFKQKLFRNTSWF